ncbi:MAG: DMT family transporter [Desulfurispora sp.]|uniref:DMT family transporter n=1 Tax=Desulfurispora sp. TaxID=3014275 RepID=UPI004048FA7D
MLLQKSSSPYLAIFIAVLAAASSAIFIKLAAAPPLVAAFYRLFFTLLILTGPLLAGSRWSELKDMARRDFLLAGLAGVFLALHFAVWFTSLEYTTISSSTVLVTLQPLFVIAGGYWLYGEKVGSGALAGALLAIGGSILVGYGDFAVGGRALWGDLLALSGAFFVALYVLMGRGLRQRLSLLPYVYVVYGVAALVLFAINWLAFQQPLAGFPAATWGWFVALAVFPTILGHTLFNWALRHVPAAVVSVSILGEPVGATVLAYLIWRQMPGSVQLAGSLAILVGLAVFISSVERHRQQ